MAKKSGLPKMYAKMGFKKGWAAYKRSKGSSSKKRRPAASRSAPKKRPAQPARRSKRRSAPVPAVVHRRKGSSMAVRISKEKLNGLTSRLSSALARARQAKSMDAAEMGVAVAEGLAAGVATSYVIGMIPVPGFVPRPDIVKPLVQGAAGFGLGVMAKNKHLKYMGYGTCLIGAMGVLRAAFPIPVLAGEVDGAMYGEPLGWTSDEGTFMGDASNSEAGFMGADSAWSPHG